MEATPSKTPRYAIMGSVAVLAIAVIVYFSFFYPPTKNEDAAGTIGAAKKYQSEQITDKDVKLGGATSEATSSSGSIVDEQTAKSYAATAAAFGNAFNQFNQRYNIGSQFVANSKATAEALGKTAQYAYGIRQDIGSKSGASFDNAAASTVYNQAAELANQASNILGKNAPTLDKQTVADLDSRMTQIASRASDMASRLQISLGTKFDLGSRELQNKTLEARKGLDNQQQLQSKQLGKQAMEKQQSLENRPKQ